MIVTSDSLVISSTNTVLSAVPANASVLMLFTLDGIATLVKVEQSLNAHPPISFTPSGISTYSRQVQPLNASDTIVVTLDGSEIDTTSSAVQPENI